MQEKVFLAEIDSLDNEQGCYANNEYFAHFFGISKVRVSEVINSLVAKGWVKSTVLPTEGNKRILKGVLKKSLRPSQRKVYDPLKEKFAHITNKITNEITNTHTAADWGFPMQPLIDAFPDVEFTPAMAGFIEGRVTPDDAEAWSKTIEIYRMNYDPMKRQYLPTKTANLLSVFDSQKTELEKKKNGTTHNTKPSALDTIRSYERIINDFPTEAELHGRTDGSDAERFN